MGRGFQPIRICSTRFTAKRKIDPFEALERYGAIITAAGDPLVKARAREHYRASVPRCSNLHVLAPQLKRVALMMAGQSEVNARRQVFFVGFGGWDQHADLKVDHEANLETVDRRLEPSPTRFDRSV